ncbi:cytochrome c-type biogenesis protein CcmH [Loktanella fryxellensis]|uniref:Cytochrome c-type biogenesis protein CcmH n=1 Tax=Loktanella fryxellensis TaxID=245187 RepID=A0A1H8BIW3_9RHOB|nr:c-type cytochrome biogenesis protein CcmI [Loktanella fryxellensis]SEM82094.1 cytochrome c-type biogenesis protein CcmH [Loktanella fryxellensis]
MFWIICFVMALGVVTTLLAPLLRPADRGEDHPQIAIYKGQLEEVDRDIERGVLNPAEAERARVEISRRLLAVSRTATTDRAAPIWANRAMAAGVTGFLLIAALLTYRSLGAPGEPDQPLAARMAQAQDMRENRPDQAALEAAAPPPPAVEAPAEYLQMIAQLRQTVPTRPDDLQGWTLLALHEARLGNYADAAQAQARVVDLKGDTVVSADLERQADLLVAAAGGIVSPQVEAIAMRLVEQDPGQIAGRYYLGALFAQTGRPDVAFRYWRPLVEGDASTFHTELARAQIEDAAVRAGMTYTAPAVRGPGVDDIAAAQDMAPEDRQAMIGGMVNQLADRLAQQGGPASDWARLISAYGVLGETQAASEVWAEAQLSFAGDTIALQLLTTAAQSAGVSDGAAAPATAPAPAGATE